MKFIFATNNIHKVEEMRVAVGDQFDVIGLREANIDIDIAEPYDTLEANASAKSRTIHQLTGMNCFSEDTGLEVEALSGEPGVKSARYAGENRSFDDNISKLLQKLRNNPNRNAKFRTIISLVWNEKEYQFEGICEGSISEQKKGTGGFGYDPVFVPVGSNFSFAEITLKEKDKFSHRKKAADKLIAFLQQQHELQKI